MNGITYARYEELTEERLSKNYELIIPHGKGKIIFNSFVEEFEEGNAIVIPPLVKHAFKGCGGLRIVFEQALLPIKSVTIIKDDEACGIAHAARQAEKYAKSELYNKALILSALGGLLVSYVTAFSDNSGFSPVVNTVRENITKGVSDSTFSLEDSMRKLPLNYDYVRKLFKKEVGITPHEYLLHERMQLARGIILGGISNQYSGYTVSQIAEACGFSEPLYFSRVFKKYFGVAPSEYKDKIQAEKR